MENGVSYTGVREECNFRTMELRYFGTKEPCFIYPMEHIVYLMIDF